MMFGVGFFVLMGIMMWAYMAGFLMGSPKRYRATRKAIEASKEDSTKWSDFCTETVAKDEETKSIVADYDTWKDKMMNKLVVKIQGEIEEFPSKC